MAFDLAAIHEAVASQITSGIADAGGFTIKAFPSTVARPCIEVWPGSDYLGYFDTFGPNGKAIVNVTVRVFLSTANAESEWLQAARLLSVGDGFTSSITDALMADTTLGGVVEALRVLNAQWGPEDGSVDIPVTINCRKQGANA